MFISGSWKSKQTLFVAVSYLRMDKDIKAMVNGQYCASNFWLLSEDYFIPQERQHYEKLIWFPDSGPLVPKRCERESTTEWMQQTV